MERDSAVGKNESELHEAIWPFHVLLLLAVQSPTDHGVNRAAVENQSDFILVTECQT